MKQNPVRENFASRAGFLLMAAGCAIGLGNVWRFSYVAGQYGGGYFVLLYLLFLAVLGFPVMVMELAIGRAGQSTFPAAFRKLSSRKSRLRWELPAFVFFAGNLILLMFYTVVTGWLLLYAQAFLRGDFQSTDAARCAELFQELLDSPLRQIIGVAVGIAISVAVCSGGVRRSLERAIKWMMGGLFLLLIVLVVRALQLPGAGDGLHFFLAPDWEKFIGHGMLETMHAAMAQAFFTLSLGVGSIAICGSYTGRDHTLAKESFWIIGLDTVVAVAAGMIIFPACATYGIAPDSGPALTFITLPNVFHNMAGGMLWGAIFFVFLAIAALSTLIAVFENLVAFGMDQWRWSRIRSAGIFGGALFVLSLPCVFGFNLWKKYEPLGAGSTVLDLEDFIVSDNMLPLGALHIAIFTFSRYGWSEENFYAEANTGRGWRLSRRAAPFFRFGVPLLILLLWMIGIVKRFLP